MRVAALAVKTLVLAGELGTRINAVDSRPEETTLYQVVREHLETFLAQVETETGASLPDFVKDEFDAFLECGILAHGFLRLRCFGSAANLNIHLHCLVLDGVYRRTAGELVFHEVRAPSIDELQALTQAGSSSAS